MVGEPERSTDNRVTNSEAFTPGLATGTDASSSSQRGKHAETVYHCLGTLHNLVSTTDSTTKLQPSSRVETNKDPIPLVRRFMQYLSFFLSFS